MAHLADVMRRELIEVAPEDTLGEVAERMSAANVGAVVVKDFGRLIGILTERDMLRRWPRASTRARPASASG